MAIQADFLCDCIDIFRYIIGFIFLLVFLACFPDIVKEKNEDPKTNNVELSKNAQFRAIRPSPSILSFVEDNVISFHISFMFVTPL